MYNTLTPIATSTHANGVSSTSAPHSTAAPSHTPKPDTTPASKRPDPAQRENHPQSTSSDRRGREEDEHTTQVRPQSPTPEQQRQHEAEKSKDRPHSPSADPSQGINDHTRVKDEENKRRQSLKGKPIIFVGGGPGRI
jgi:hypothetical protein